MKLEADYKREIVREVKLAGGYARRIEDQYSVGFPDLIVVYKAACFIEVKRIIGNVFAPSPRQYIELLALNKPPVCFAMLVGVDENGRYYFAEPEPSSTKVGKTAYFNFIPGLTAHIERIRNDNGPTENSTRPDGQGEAGHIPF